MISGREVVLSVNKDPTSDGKTHVGPYLLSDTNLVPETLTSLDPNLGSERSTLKPINETNTG